MASIVALVTACTPTAAPPPTPERAPTAAPASTASPSPTVPPRASEETIEQRRADLDALLAALATHPEPPDLATRAQALRTRVGELTDEQFLVELMRLAATRDEDGHTGIFPLAQPDLQLWPIRLYAFEEGWRVIAAMAPHDDLVGEEVTAIGGRAVEEVADLVRSTVPHDTAASTLGRLPQHLITPDVLRGVDVAPTLEVAGRDVDITPVPAEEYAGWAQLPYPLICPPLVDRAAPPWGVDEVEGAVAITYRTVAPRVGEQGMSELVAEVEEAVGRLDADAVVLDLRDNPGGDTGTARGLVDALVRLEQQRPGRLRLLVNRCTFSAATNVVVQLLEATDALVVGEEMGGSPRMWGDAHPHTLPSGTVVHVATRTWELGGADAPDVLVPDVPVPVRWADHVAGADVALEAAVTGP